METERDHRIRKLQAARERLSILRQFASWLDTPMAILSAAWLYLMVVEFVWGLNALGERLFMVIWVVFIIDFTLRLLLAPRKLRYLRRNWLCLCSSRPSGYFASFALSVPWRA